MNITPTDLLDPVEPLTTKEALAERERLRNDLAKLAKVVDESAAREREIKKEMTAIEAELVKQRQEAVLHGERVSESAARKDLAALGLEAADLVGSIEAARVMRRKIELELHYLHVQQFGPLADHAENLREKANSALEKLRPLYDEAIGSYNAGRDEWELLVRAHNDGRGAGPGTIIRPDGSVRTPEDAPPRLSSIPPCPLVPLPDTFDLRPPELEVETDPE